MLSTVLETVLSPFRLLANKGALSPQYRAIELAPTRISAVAPFGAATVLAPLGITETVHVDAAAFLATVSSVPNAEMHLSIKDGSLVWRCGTAKGRLGLMPDVVLPRLPLAGKQIPVTDQLIRAFKLGALSAGGARDGMGTENMRGVVLDNRGQPMVYATDNATLSVYILGDTPLIMPELATISEQGAELLASVMRPGGSLSVTDTALMYQSDTVAAMVQQTRPMEYDLRAHIDRYEYDTDQVLEIPAERIGAFARLASTLAAKAANSRVQLTVGDGQLALSFQEGSTQMDEYYLTDALQGFPTQDPVELPADKLVKVLAHAKGIVVEHLHQNPTVIFCDGPFRCLVSGQ